MAHDASQSRRRIAVIGGGIAGLAAAHRVVELEPAAEIVLFEASGRLGGVLHTERRDGFLLELGADSFITSVPWAIDLCRRIGFADQLIETNPAHRRALVVRDGRLYPVPEGFMLMEPRALWPVMKSPLLSVRGKMRVLAELLVRARRDGADESLASFARRRLGREAFERLVQPLVAGIYTADPEKLSLAATLPRFLEMERRHGGLIRAARERDTSSDEAEGGARYSMFVAPRDGMQSLAEAVAARLPAGTVRLNSAVTRVTPRAGGGWEVWLDSGGQGAGGVERAGAAFACEAVILAVAAPLAGRLVEPFDTALAASLAGIPYAGTAIVLVGYDDGQLARPLDGFGFVVPDVEHRPILSASFSSVKFPGRAPDGKTLVRVFIGGAMRPDLATAPEEELRRIAASELAALLGAKGDPVFLGIAPWPAAMPQYHLGHLERVAEIEKRVAAWPNFALAGNAYRGVGVPHCIKSGEAAAERVVATRARR
ncbi:MAG: protoporphyrinogen oxidase [Planctomycetia bacterium]|nr:protoporphyrinogen oxidase [Planctomycetia bacterium]